MFPRVAYHTARVICRECSVEFVFTAEEQRIVFEQEQKHPDYLPTRCGSCASQHNQKRGLRKHYDTDILRVVASDSFDEKRQMIKTIDALLLLCGHIPGRMATRRAQLLKQVMADETSDNEFR